MSTFSADDLRLLERADEVTIETPRAGREQPRRTIVWIVVDAGTVYVRSVRGVDGAWYKAASGGAPARLDAGSKTWPIRLAAANSADEISRVSAAIEAKYLQRWPGPTAAMLRPEVLSTTLRVEPT